MKTLKWTKLKDNPDLKDEISTIIERLKYVNDDDSRRHLADTGCSLRSIANDLKYLSKKTFNRHNHQKVA